MIPSRLTVQELFEKTIQYTVPLYQRSYVWGQDQQWEPLWEDIRDKADNPHSPPHFLGAVVLNQVKTFGNELSKKQIIDGQQRLTTLQVFLAALRDLAALHALDAQTSPDLDLRDAFDALCSSLKPLTQNHGVMKNRQIEQHKLWPTNFDQDIFAHVMTAKSLTALNDRFPIVRLPRKRTPEPGPALVEAYRFFDQRIRDLIASASPHALSAPDLAQTYDALMSLYSALKGGFHLVVIELESDDDPQVIFETLNARGVPLLASDLIRNLIFGRATAQGHDTNALYDQFWRPYDETSGASPLGFWKETVKQGRLKRPRLDMFFQHYLAARSGQEVLPAHVFQSFRAWWDSARPERSAPDELATLQRFSEVFRDLMEPHRLAASDPTLSRTLTRLRALDTHTIYPLLLWLLTLPKDALSRPARDAILCDLESFLVRHWIVGSSTKNYNKLFSQLLRDLQKHTAPTPADLRAQLLRIGGDNAWPTDDAFQTAWMESPAYHRLGSHGVQMILGAVHEKMLTSKQEAVLIQGPLTVEHVMPQSWADHWPLPPDAPDGAASSRDGLIQTFGNLTLLTQPLNSAVSNGPFLTKRDAITTQSLLLLNTYFIHQPTWDEATIQARGQALLAFALKLWPHPTPQLDPPK
jgi:hypothetical protein